MPQMTEKELLAIMAAIIYSGNTDWEEYDSVRKASELLDLTIERVNG